MLADSGEYSQNLKKITMKTVKSFIRKVIGFVKKLQPILGFAGLL